MNQREATVNCILSILEERGITYELNGPTPISSILTSDDKKQAREILHAMFLKGEIDFKVPAKMSDAKYMNSYVSGLVNNWVSKAPEFNCSVKHVAKNPGSRAGSGDEMIKEMKKLLVATVDQATREVIQTAIDLRVSEIKPMASVVIDASLLPDSLKHLVK